MKRGECFPCEVSDPVTELVGMCSDESSLLEIQGMTYGKLGVAHVTVSWGFWRICVVAYNENVAPN